MNDVYVVERDGVREVLECCVMYQSIVGSIVKSIMDGIIEC